MMIITNSNVEWEFNKREIHNEKNKNFVFGRKRWIVICMREHE